MEAPIDLPALIALAEAATPFSDSGYWFHTPDDRIAHVTTRFVRAADPATILAMASELIEARKVVEAARDAIQQQAKYFDRELVKALSAYDARLTGDGGTP